MADDMRITSLPNAGSHEAVALELWKALRSIDASKEDQLKFYIQCRSATFGKAPS